MSTRSISVSRSREPWPGPKRSDRLAGIRCARTAQRNRNLNTCRWAPASGPTASAFSSCSCERQRVDSVPRALLRSRPEPVEWAANPPAPSLPPCPLSPDYEPLTTWGSLSMLSNLRALLSEPNVCIVRKKTLAAIDEAVAYGNSASVGAAYDSLLKLREKIKKGRTLRVSTTAPREFASVSEFDDWVRDRYPVFLSDPHHPAFHRKENSFRF